MRARAIRPLDRRGARLGQCSGMSPWVDARLLRLKSAPGMHPRVDGVTRRRVASLGVPVSLAATAVSSVVLAASASAATPFHMHQRWIETPGAAVECWMNQGKSTETFASCGTKRPLQAATVYPDGHVLACYGTTLRTGQCLMNAPARTPTLAYGRAVVLGPFRCRSLRTGVRCVVIRSGHGFLISRSGISHF